MQSAVHYQPDESPVLELAAQEFVFPISVEQGGEEYVALFHMTPYPERELTEFLDGSAGEFYSSGRARVMMEPAVHTGYAELFDRHFIGLSGVEGDPSVEQQKTWMAPQERLKRRVIQEGYGGGEIVNSPNGAVPHGRLRLADISANRIAIRWGLWSTDKSRAERITTTHVLRPETADDHRRYTQATTRLETHTRKGTWKVLVNHTALRALYDAMVEEITGCVCKGVPCSATSRNEWLGLVPCWHKVAVVHEVFAGASVKNA